MTGAEVLVRCLEEEGVTTVFGYPGVAICPFYESLAYSGIRSVLVRTEQNAAHMASGMARMNAKPGVCAVTSGPGATNVLTGIATAFADSIPLICITGQVESSLIGSDVFQEADITGAAESFVKYSYLIKRASNIPRIVKEAFHIANTGRKGPVLLDIPIDVQKEAVLSFAYPDQVSLRTYKPTVKGHAIQIKRVLSELKTAKRPILCVGGGVHLAGASEAIRLFAAKHRIPVVSTMMGIGVMPSQDPLYFGMVGNNGAPISNRAMNECDVLLMVGARVADRAVSQPGLITKNKILVHIDVDPAEIGKNAGPSIPLVGDAKHIFEHLLQEDFTADYDEWLETLSMERKQIPSLIVASGDFVNPSIFLQILSMEMQEDAVYVADVGQNQIWSCRYHEVKKGRFFTSGGMGTMGYSIPAAIGAKLADPDRQVVAVCGDGSFQMSMMELATMRQHNIPIKIIVFNNTTLGMVREYQHFTYQDHYTMVDLSGSPNLEKIAQAYDMAFLRLETVDIETNQAMIKKLLSTNEAVLMECRIDPLAQVKIPAQTHSQAECEVIA